MRLRGPTRALRPPWHSPAASPRVPRRPTLLPLACLRPLDAFAQLLDLTRRGPQPRHRAVIIHAGLAVALTAQQGRRLGLRS